MLVVELGTIIWVVLVYIVVGEQRVDLHLPIIGLGTVVVDQLRPCYQVLLH